MIDFIKGTSGKNRLMDLTTFETKDLHHDLQDAGWSDTTFK